METTKKTLTAIPNGLVFDVKKSEVEGLDNARDMWQYDAILVHYARERLIAEFGLNSRKIPAGNFYGYQNYNIYVDGKFVHIHINIIEG